MRVLLCKAPDRSQLRHVSGKEQDGQVDTYVHLDGRVYVHDAWGQWFLLETT